MGAIHGHHGLLMPGSAAAPAVTWNPADKSANITLSGGNLIATSSSALSNKLVRATLGRSSGKHYFEALVSATTDISLGVAEAALPTSSYVGSSAGSYGYYQLNGSKYNNGSGAAYGSNFQSGVIIGVAVDFTAGMIWFSRAGVFQASGDPAAGTNAAFSGLSGVKFPAVNLYNSSVSATGRFKAADFTYSPPTGFSAWE